MAAAEIFNKAASPTSSESGERMSPDQYKTMDKTPNDIVSQDQADGYNAFAHDREVSMGTVPAYQEPGGAASGSASSGSDEGMRPKANEIDSDTGDSEGGGSRGRGHAQKPSAPHVAGSSDHGQKTSADHSTTPSKHASNGYSFNNSAKNFGGGGTTASGPLHGKAGVDNALKNANLGDPDKRHAQMKNSDLVDSSVDSARLGKAAFRIHTDAVGDVAKDVVDSATKPGGLINNLAKWGNGGIKEVQDDINAVVKISKDSAKEMLGIDDKP